jgi:cytochrome P450 family 4
MAKAIVLLSAVAGIFVYFTVIFIQRKWQLRKFPGPFALPLVGNCYDPQALVFLKYLMVLRKKFGKVYSFFSFTKGFLVVCDPIVARRVLSDVKMFPKGADYTVIFNFVFGEGLVTSNGEKHKRDRATFGKYFIRANLSKCASTMNQITKATFKQYITADRESVSINVEEMFAKLAFRTFMKFSMNADLTDRPELETLICHQTSVGSNATGRIIVFNLPLWNIFPEVQAMKEYNETTHKLCHELIETRKRLIAEGKDTDIDDCLSAMLREQLPEKEMIEHISTLMAAGHDTTAFFISYLVYLLAAHPQEQERVYREILHVVGIARRLLQRIYRK